MLLLLAQLAGRGYNALVVWGLAAFSIPKEQMREKVARALKLKPTTAFCFLLSLSLGKRKCRNINFFWGEFGILFFWFFLYFHVTVLCGSRAVRCTARQRLALIFVDTLRFRE